MNGIFVDHLTLSSKYTPDEMQRLLSESVVPPGSFKWWSPSHVSPKPYEGEVVDMHFRFRRVIEHRNDLLPFAYGTIATSGSGSIVRATIEPSHIARVAIAVWITLASLVGLVMVITRVRMGSLDLLAFVPFALAGFGYVAAYFSFSGEAKQVKAFLYRIVSEELS